MEKMDTEEIQHGIIEPVEIDQIGRASCRERV